MTVKKLKHDEHRNVRTAFRGRPSQCDGFEALDKLDIAELSDTVINQMTCDELVRMIRVANLPALLRPALDRRLPFYDHTVLTRLAHLAKRYCCNQRPGSQIGRGMKLSNKQDGAVVVSHALTAVTDS